MLANHLRKPMKALRFMTAPLRSLPDFIIIGAQRAGTSSLFRYLAEHPHCIPSQPKEVHYFDRNYWKGRRWYRTHFPTALRRRSRQKPRITGEASPYYLFHPLAPQRARESVPNARLLVLLRNPVDRAYSHYQHVVRQGEEPLPFEDAIAREEERLKDEVKNIRTNPRYDCFRYRTYSYLSRGIYADQLKRWLRYFPRNQLLILKSEELFEDPRGVLRRSAEFLGLAPVELTDYRRYNRLSYAPMKASTREYLADFYEPHNWALSTLLDVDFGWES